MVAIGVHPAAGRANFEVPLVCPNCNLVHRVGKSAFNAPAVTCPSCGFERPSQQLVATMPRFLRHAA